MSEFSVTLIVAKDAAGQLKRLRLEKPKVATLVYENFIQPIHLKYKAEHLVGKYKPSWMVPSKNTRSMAHGMADIYRKKSCYHYHFGYPFYTEGRDPEFRGRESAGILHTVFNFSEKHESHKLLYIDESHPSPFQVPLSVLMQA